jgi:IS5 family transposase
MRPKAPEPSSSSDLFRNRLENLLDQRHELCRLADLIDWSRFDTAFGSLYCPDNGCPAKATRLMVGLQYLKHTYGLSDEEVVMRWVENPYWQYFCGEEYFQHQMPIDPSSMSRFRRRIGESGCETILQGTVEAGLESKTIKRNDLKRVTVDTTVQEKAVSFPTDSKLLNRSRGRLVKLCRKQDVVLRQSYARKGPEALLLANRYAHARQMRRMRRQVRKLRTYLGRVVRDIERKIADCAGQQAVFADELALAKRLLTQKKTDSKKLYSLHAPEVECISKGKAHKRYEFGVKASIAATHRSNFLVGGMALPGNPFDGHTLVDALAQVRRLTGSRIDEAFVDRGYRGHGEMATTVYISGQKRGIKTQRLRRSLKRRQAIEPIIGHLKSDGLLGRNYLKGTVGDHMNVMLSCAGHNLRLILRHLRIFWLWILDVAVRTAPGTHPMGHSRPLVTGWIAERNLPWRGINTPTSQPVPI